MQISGPPADSISSIFALRLSSTSLECRHQPALTWATKPAVRQIKLWLPRRIQSCRQLMITDPVSQRRTRVRRATSMASIFSTASVDLGLLRWARPFPGPAGIGSPAYGPRPMPKGRLSPDSPSLPNCGLGGVTDSGSMCVSEGRGLLVACPGEGRDNAPAAGAGDARGGACGADVCGSDGRGNNGSGS